MYSSIIRNIIAGIYIFHFTGTGGQPNFKKFGEKDMMKGKGKEGRQKEKKRKGRKKEEKCIRGRIITKYDLKGGQKDIFSPICTVPSWEKKYHFGYIPPAI